MWHLIPWMRRMFLKIEIDNPINTEAADLYENDREGFITKVDICVKFRYEATLNHKIAIFEKSHNRKEERFQR